MGSFEKLGLSNEALEVIRQKGFETPTPIQEKTIPALLLGKKDIVGQAQTGTGKTAAFGLPLIQLLMERSKHVQVLVLAPTRELAIQVAEEINSLKGRKKISVVPIYGGQSIILQLRSLQRGVDIVVGTPGRIMDHMRRGTVRFDKISYLVLDEADEMLNMGFLEDVRDIMKTTPANKRTLLFSATMPHETMQIAKKYMGEYDLLKVVKDELTVSKTDQIYFEVSESNRFEALCRIIDMEDDFYGLVFCRTKVDVDKIASHLIERGYEADALHGDISQILRGKILNKLKKRAINILVATDVAARGIDVQNLTHVINYSLPQDPESYVHRIGRTGRAGKKGNAVTFITPEEYRKLQFIKRGVKSEIRKAVLPKVKDVIKIKKLKIKSRIEDIVKSNCQNEYLDLSRELLKGNSPEDILGALLYYSFQDELNEKSYTEIEEVVVDTKGKTRLFVRQGKVDGLTPRKLEDLIITKCNISKDKIRDIQVYDKFSFVTLPFHDAEKMLSLFSKRRSGKGIFVSKANKKGQKS